MSTRNVHQQFVAMLKFLSAKTSTQKWRRLLHSSAQTRTPGGDKLQAASLKKICKILMSSPTADVSEVLQKSKVEASPKLVEEVLKRFENAGMQAYRFFEWAGKQQGYSHSVEAYHIIIDSLGKIRQYGLMWTVVNLMKIKGVLTKEAFAVIIRRYANVKKVKEAVYTFDTMEKFGVPADLEAFNSLLSALCKCKNVRTAQEIFDRMKVRFKPDLKTYSILLQGWGNEPNLTKARAIFNEMSDRGCEPDMVAYALLMNALCKGGQVEEALALIDTMKTRGSNPNTYIYSILIHTYGAEKRIDDAVGAFTAMEESGCEPDTPTYNALIGAFCNVRKFNEAYTVLDEMVRKRIGPNAKTYNVILHHLISLGEIEEAYCVFRRMVKEHCDPDIDTYTMMIKMFCAENKVDMALKVWKHMGGKRFCPTMHTFSVLINGLCERDRMNEACAYFEEMVEKGIRPSAATYNRLRRGLMKVGREDILEDLSEKMKELTKEPRED